MDTAILAPIAAEPVWRPVMEAAGWQCQCTGGCGRTHAKEPGHRCPHTHKPYRLLVASPIDPTGDPHRDLTGEQVAYCPTCYDGRLSAAKRAARAAAAEHEMDTPLFDLDFTDPKGL
ncbi:MAG: hypothetical protein ACJ786_33860 [Catenulispora sp.]